MLVKFDHLTLVVNRNDAQRTIEQFQEKGYRLTLTDDNAVNMPSKLNYMQFKDVTHGLYFMEAPNAMGLSVEIIAYEHTTQNKSWIEYNPLENALTVLSKELDACKKMFLTFGCDQGDKEIVFNGALDPASYIISFREDNGMAKNLDNEGFCCPTIFVKPGNKTKTKLEEAGYYCTDPDVFETSGKTMFVFFALGKDGEIVEFVTNKL